MLFISHSSQDDAFVRELRATLADHGHEGWIDSRELRGGDPLWTEIQTAIEEASAYAVLVSPDSLQSKWVGKELRHALALRDQRGKDKFPVIPLSLNGTKLGVLEEFFGEEPIYIPVSSDAGGVEAAMNAILVAMGQRLSADVPATAQPKAEPLETNQLPNPFPAFAACLFSEAEIPTLVLEAIVDSRAAIDEYLHDSDNEATQRGRSVVIRGGHGSGKTHLLTDLAHQMRNRRDDSTRIYSRGDANSLEFYKQLVHQISMERLFQLIDTANKRAGNVDTDKWHALRELVGPDLDPALENAFRSSDPAQAERAYRWLLGDPVQGFGELSAVSQSSILQMITVLHRAARVPLLVLIDELEGMLETSDKKRESFDILKRMVETFVRNGACLVVAGLDEAWDLLPADVIDRFGRKPQLHLAELSGGGTKQLLELYASGNTRLSTRAVAAIHQQSGGNPGKILSIAHRLFEMFAGELQAATPDTVAQVAKETATQLHHAEFPARQSGITEHVSAHTDNPALVDELDRKPFAEVIGIRIEQVARSQVDGNREASAFMVNLHGPWGAGKTSVLNFLKAYLQAEDRAPKDRWVVVEFNAWRHQRLQPPWWTLIKEIQAQAVRQLNIRDSIHVRIGWLWWRIRADWLPSIAAAVLILVAVLLTTGVITLTKQAAGVPGPALTPQNPVTPDADQIAKAIELALKIIAALAATGAAVLALSRSLVFGSGSAAKAYVDARSDPLRPIITLFRRLVKAVRRPLIVLVDDLDRCDGPYVIALLEGIQTLFRSAPVTYVVAADRKWICSSFEQKYGGFEKAIGEPGRPLGYLFLDKVFQVSGSVPRLSQELQRTYWNALLGADTGRPSDVKNARQEADKKANAEVKNDRTSEQLDARIEATKATEDPIAQQAMRAAAAKQIISPEAMQVTEHRLKHFSDLVEANPRSMKRLVNAYGLYQASHFLEGRTVPPEVLVRWTILELRWPLLAEHLAARPHTLRSFKAGESLGQGLSDEIRTLLNDDTVQAVLGFDVKSKTIKLDEQSVRQIIGTSPGTS